VSTVVRAAGGIPVRGAGRDLELLVIHRARYGDWTLPKGKCEPGETDEACALREVEEETGLVCELQVELPSTEYRDARDRTKRVRYWVLRVVSGEARPVPPEVDEVRWVPAPEAVRLLTYERDVSVVEAALR
jgi:8-oxo-dGTP diphosphatase